MSIEVPQAEVIAQPVSLHLVGAVAGQSFVFEVVDEGHLAHIPDFGGFLLFSSIIKFLRALSIHLNE